jgi:hypothetical protein
LIDKENHSQKEYITALRTNNIRFTLDVLEIGRTKEGRVKIAIKTGVPEDFIAELVNRADFTRMPYISGKTVWHYFTGGYNSLEKLVNSDLDKLREDMTKYFDSIGRKLSRPILELDSGIIILKILLKIVKQ